MQNTGTLPRGERRNGGSGRGPGAGLLSTGRVARPALVGTVAAAFVLAPFAVPAVAQEAPVVRGPAFGNNRYGSAIGNPSGRPDVDDFVANLTRGEQLTVKVVAGRRSALRPTIVLVRPDGDGFEPALRLRRGGRVAKLAAFEIDVSGRWGVRVLGKDRTEGTYKIAFKIAPPPKVRVDGVLGGSAPLVATHGFEAAAPAALDVRLSWRKGDSPVEVRGLRGPAGDVPFPSVLKSGRSRRVRLRDVPLDAGTGPYEIDVGTGEGGASYRLVLQVYGADRPSSRTVVALSPDEPFLAERTTPIRGREAEDVRILGENFAEDSAPEVSFGGIRSDRVLVDDRGRALTARVPAGLPVEAVRVAVVNPDGQATSRSGYFRYAPPPQVDDLLRVSRDPAVGGSTNGDELFVVVGAGLHPSQVVSFGGSAAEVTGSLGATELVVRSPPGAEGFVDVVVRDEFDRAATLDRPFEYKTPPSFAQQPYDPSFGDPGVARTVTVSGTGFLPTDRALLDGAAVPWAHGRRRDAHVPRAGRSPAATTSSRSSTASAPPSVHRPTS